jgi:hypothetical protein
VRERIRSRLSFANVTALLALVIALGGTSYALTLGRNSVGKKQIASGAVRSPEVRNDALRERDLGFDPITGAELDLASASASAPESLASNGGFEPLATLNAPGAGEYLVTAFAQASAAACNGPVSMVARVTLDGQTSPSYPDMRLDLDPSGADRAPIGLGGLLKSSKYANPARGSQHTIELLARVEAGPNVAPPGCAQVLDRNLNAIRLSE